MPLPPEPQAVLDFWFGLKNPGPKDDARVKEACEDLYRLAVGGELEHWAEHPRERLALLLLVDQIPRHIFRDLPEAYAADTQARALTGRFMADQDWRDFTPLEKFYASLPWLHAEEVAKQEAIHRVLQEVAPRIAGLEFMARVADLYLETIRRFGRFPHRNELLGRTSTPEEALFLKEEWHQRRKRNSGKG